jgi:hypothetical protein
MHTVTLATPPIKRNRCMCRICGDVIESSHSNDKTYCSCGRIFTNGGNSFIERGFTDDGDILPMDEYWQQVIDLETV